MSLKLVLNFKDETGTTRKWSFNNADVNVTNNAVKALVQGMITNGSIFQYPPVMATSAKLVQVTETDIQLSDD